MLTFPTKYEELQDANGRWYAEQTDEFSGMSRRSVERYETRAVLVTHLAFGPPHHRWGKWQTIEERQMSDAFTPTPVPDWLGKTAPQPPPEQEPPPAPQAAPDPSTAWLAAEPEPQSPANGSDPEPITNTEAEHIEREAEADAESEVVEMIAEGLLALKRVWQWPANTQDEADAARDFARLAVNWVTEYKRA